jgi:hypothetical protein
MSKKKTDIHVKTAKTAANHTMNSSLKGKKSTLSAAMTRKIFYALSLLVLVSIGYVLACESELLFHIQEHSLWLKGNLFLEQLATYPAWATTYAGTFLTQFFYYPWVGIAIWLVLSALLVWLVRKAYRVPRLWTMWLWVPSILLLCSNLQMGYWIYTLKLKGYFFSTFVGFLIVTAAVWLFRWLITNRRKQVRIGAVIWMFFFVSLYHPLGYFSLLGGAYMILLTWLLPVRRTHASLITLLGVACILFTPMVWYQYFDNLNFDYIYTAGFPSFRPDDGVLRKRMCVPYVLLMGMPVFLMLASRFVNKQPNKWLAVGNILLPIALMAGLVHYYWYRDDNFHKEIEMAHAVEKLDWEKVLEIARSETHTPTRMMIQYKTLALFRLGRAGDELYHYLDGSELPAANFHIHMMQVGGKTLYYHYGKENFCYRWCIEDGVEFGNKIEYLKFLVKTSILNNEKELAQKYINSLKRTLFYREWAEKYEGYLLHPERVTEDPEMKEILYISKFKDQLDGDNALVEMYLLNAFAHGNGDEPHYQELTLIAALQSKDIALFWPRFTKYAMLHPKDHMPIHYQEAAYLYGNLEKKVDISRMPFDPSVKESYEQFMRMSLQYRNMSEEEMARLFYPQFGNTFYYFYFFVRNVKSY